MNNTRYAMAATYPSIFNDRYDNIHESRMGYSILLKPGLSVSGGVAAWAHGPMGPLN